MRSGFISLLSALALSVPAAAFAQTADEHSAHHPQGQAAAPGTAEQAPEAGAQALDQGIKKLQDLMTRIQQAKDPEQREALLHEHMVAMLDQMKLIRKQAASMKMAMMGGGMGMMGMMGGQQKQGAKQSGEGGMMGGDMMGGMMGGGMMRMHKMMERRIETLELMLEQAIEHAHAREAAQH
jgi:hypothetical protein